MRLRTSVSAKADNFLKERWTEALIELSTNSTPHAIFHYSNRRIYITISTGTFISTVNS
jgi:hypothetical protein